MLGCLTISYQHSIHAGGSTDGQSGLSVFFHDSIHISHLDEDQEIPQYQS